MFIFIPVEGDTLATTVSGDGVDRDLTSGSDHGWSHL